MIVPELLSIPQKLMPLIRNFDQFRFHLIEGGRSSGKSSACCRFLLYLGDQYSLRILCIREYMNTLAESSHALLSDLIQKYNLNYDIQREKITHRTTGTTFHFRGLRESGALSLQGYEAADLCFCDESQALSSRSIQVLIPTVRKPNSRFIFVMNRYLPTDPIYEFLVGRSDCQHLTCNYTDNPWCPPEILREAEVLRAKNLSEYNHVYGGMPLDLSDDALFSVSELEEARAKDFPMSDGYGIRVGGFDPSRYGQDFTAVTILEQRGQNHWQLIKTFEWSKMDLNYSTGRLKGIIKEYDVSKCACDIDGLGSGPYDILTAGHRLDAYIPFSNVKLSHNDYANARTKNFYELKEMLRNGHLALPGNDKLISELLNIRFTFDASQRRILLSKEQMKKQGIPSPNLADALAMSMSALNEVHEGQSIRYEGSWKQPRYSKEEDLFPRRPNLKVAT